MSLEAELKLRVAPRQLSITEPRQGNAMRWEPPKNVRVKSPALCTVRCKVREDRHLWQVP
jgi:hypothetical protein